MLTVALLVVALTQLAIGYMLGRFVTMRRRAAPSAPVERATLSNPRGLWPICIIHVFGDKDGRIPTTIIPNASTAAHASVDWPAVGDAVVDAAGYIAHGSLEGATVGDALSVSRPSN